MKSARERAIDMQFELMRHMAPKMSRELLGMMIDQMGDGMPDVIKSIAQMTAIIEKDRAELLAWHEAR